MAVDERARHELYEQAEAAMSRSSADTLMSLLPPVGWADVATKHDLSELEARLDTRIDALGDRLDGRIDALGDRLDGRIGALGDRLDGRMGALEGRFDSVEQRMEMRFELLAAQILAGTRKEINTVMLKMFALMVALVPALVIPLVTLR